MAGLWRVTRNRYGRAAYEALTARGLTATWMIEYVRALDTASDPDDHRLDPDFRVEATDGSAVEPLDAPVEEVLDGEQVVAAFDRDTPLGYLFVSVDAALEVVPLERSLCFDGAYIRRVYVAPEHRQRGVASALLETACHLARDRGGSRATALVALDNRPSRWLFEKHGFEPVRDYRYLRTGPLSVRSTRHRDTP
jgi:GNAT superfamily N-acetyltransferase